MLVLNDVDEIDDSGKEVQREGRASPRLFQRNNHRPHDAVMDGSTGSSSGQSSIPPSTTPSTSILRSGKFRNRQRPTTPTTDLDVSSVNTSPAKNTTAKIATAIRTEETTQQSSNSNSNNKTSAADEEQQAAELKLILTKERMRQLESKYGTVDQADASSSMHAKRPNVTARGATLLVQASYSNIRTMSATTRPRSPPLIRNTERHLNAWRIQDSTARRKIIKAAVSNANSNNTTISINNINNNHSTRRKSDNEHPINRDDWEKMLSLLPSQKMPKFRQTAQSLMACADGSTATPVPPYTPRKIKHRNKVRNNNRDTDGPDDEFHQGRYAPSDSEESQNSMVSDNNTANNERQPPEGFQLLSVMCAATPESTIPANKATPPLTFHGIPAAMISTTEACIPSEATFKQHMPSLLDSLSYDSHGDGGSIDLRKSEHRSFLESTMCAAAPSGNRRSIPEDGSLHTLETDDQSESTARPIFRGTPATLSGQRIIPKPRTITPTGASAHSRSHNSSSNSHNNNKKNHVTPSPPNTTAFEPTNQMNFRIIKAVVSSDETIYTTNDSPSRAELSSILLDDDDLANGGFHTTTTTTTNSTSKNKNKKLPELVAQYKAVRSVPTQTTEFSDAEDGEWSMLMSTCQDPLIAPMAPIIDHNKVIVPPLHFFGRKKELSKLRQAFLRSKSMTNRCEIVMLEGAAGVGKTAICQHFFGTMNAASFFLACGSFEPQMGESPEIHPYAPICSMFSGLLRQVIDQDERWVKKHLSRDLQSAFRRLCKSFCEFQCFTEVEGDSPCHEYYENGTGFRRLDLTLRNLLRVICQTSHVVIWMDDVQWMSPQCAAILQTILRDPQGHRLLFVGTQRPDTTFIGRSPEQSKYARAKVDFPLPIDSAIKVANFDKESIGELLLGHFRSFDEVEILSLAERLHAKTQGSAFLVTEFVRLIHANGLVSIDSVTKRWKWSIEPVLMKTAVIDHPFTLVAEIVDSRTSPDVRAVLLFASFLGSKTFDAGMLLQVFNTTETEKKFWKEENRISTRLPKIERLPDLEALLSSAVDAGILERAQEPRMYRFALNLFWESLRAIIFQGLNDSDRICLHRFIGRNFQTYHDMERRYIQVVPVQLLQLTMHHCSCDTSFIDMNQNGMSLVELHILAAQAALEVWSFSSAILFLQNASMHIDAAPWTSQYSTMVRYTTTLAKACIFAGKFEQGRTAAIEAISRSRSLDTKCHMYRLLILSYSSQGRSQEAILASLDILDQLKFSLPRKLPKVHVKTMLPKVKKLLATTPPEAWSEIDKCASKKIDVGQGFLFQLFEVATKAGNSHYRLLSMMLLITSVLEHGSQYWVPVALAGAAMVMNKAGEINEVERHYKLCLAFVKERAEDCGQNRLALGLIYTYLHHYYRPIQDSLEGLAYSYSLGLQAGDFEAMVMTMVSYGLTYIYAGSELRCLQADMIQFMSLVDDYGNTEHILLVRPILQLLLNIVGEGGQSDSKEFLGYVLNATNRNTILYRNFDGCNGRVLYMLRHCQMVHAYLMDDQKTAQAMSSQIQGTKFKVYSPAWLVQEHLFHGLIAFRWDHPRRGSKWIGLLEDSIAKANHGYNLALVLLQAAHASTNQNMDAAVVQEHFDKAIEIAEQSGNNFLSALNCELAAQYFIELQSRTSSLEGPWVSIYLQRAFCLYARWGAAGKCVQLHDVHSDSVFFMSFTEAAKAELPPKPPQLTRAAQTPRVPRLRNLISPTPQPLESTKHYSKMPAWMKRLKRSKRKSKRNGPSETYGNTRAN